MLSRRRSVGPVGSATCQEVRERLGAELFRRVAGPDGPRHRERIHGTPGPRWFPADSAIARVHGDASMFVGGIRAVLLQTMHPAAMTAVAEHSGYRGDMWGRLARTSRFLAVTTFGTERHAEQAVEAVRSIHERVVGTLPDGTPYAASRPAPAEVGARGRDRELPARPPGLRRRPVGPAGPRRLRRPDRGHRSQARGHRPADDRRPSWPPRSPSSVPSWPPPRRHAKPSRSWSGTPTCRGPHARRTARWWPPRSG